MKYRYYNSTTVIEHYKAQGDNSGIAHAKAFGACWAVMTPEQKDYIFRYLNLEIPQEKDI